MFLQVVGRRRQASLAQANAGINLTYQQIVQSEAGTIADAASASRSWTHVSAIT
jgi:hypothetical protein